MELKIGQRWRTRGGAIAYVHAHNDGRQWSKTRFPWIARFYPNGTDCDPVYGAVSGAGWYYDTRTDARDLVELLEDVPSSKWPAFIDPRMLELPAAGDSHEAVTFHPLPTPSLDALAGIVSEPEARALRQEPGLAINPKDAIGSSKLPLHLWPAEATALGCLGLLEGDEKYGRNNYIAGGGVLCSIYIDAAKRHLDAWFSGEEVAPDSGIPHLANALASIAIIVKARAHGRLIDDRDYTPNPGSYREFIESITPHVPRIKALFADKHPRRFTIADNPVVDRKKSDDTEGGAL